MKNTDTKYTYEQVTLIQEIFRHKIVHLARLKLAVYNNNEIHSLTSQIESHLKIDAHPCTEIKTILIPMPISYHIFTISITKLLSDIENSVIGQPDGEKKKNSISDVAISDIDP
jgi:hypothetical protein